MKRNLFLYIFFLIVTFAKAQVTCNNFDLQVDWQHYTVDPITGDSTFVKYFQFDISDTSNVAKINYSLFVVNNGTQAELQDFDFGSTSSNTDMTNNNAYRRVKKKMKVSLGKFKYQNKSYLVKIKLYDQNNNLIGSTDFNFDH